MTPEQDAALRAHFPPEVVGKLPKTTCKKCSASDSKVCGEHTKAKCPRCGNYMTTQHIDLDYVGHAEVTDRLLTVDPGWTWEPAGRYETGEPVLSNNGTGLWIKMTVCGVTRMGYGDVEKNKAGNGKELISDAIRNAAMRFGVALYLWSKNELESALVGEPLEETPAPELAGPAVIGALAERIAALPDALKAKLKADWTSFSPLARLLESEVEDVSALVALYEAEVDLSPRPDVDASTGEVLAAGPPTAAPAPPSTDPGRPFEEAPVG